jgi:hypothetical protein
LKIVGAYHGLIDRVDEKGRPFYALSIEGLRVDIPTSVVSGIVPILRSLPVGSEISCRIAPAWRGSGERRWLSWVLLSLDSRDGNSG